MSWIIQVLSQDFRRHPTLQEQLPLQALRLLHTRLWGQNKFKSVPIAGGGQSYSTLDLTLFDNTKDIPPDQILLVREEYIRAYNAILAKIILLARKRVNPMLITGNPGIGKTLFLFYVLARRLQEKKPVALEIDPKQFALFDELGVTLHSSVHDVVSIDTWALCDESSEWKWPCPAFQTPFVTIIYASSPAFRRWEGWVRRLCATHFFMDVWSLEELKILLTIRNLDVPYGEALFQKFGPIPGIIVEILTEPTKEELYLTDVRAAANEIARNLSTHFNDLFLLDFTSDIPSKIFAIRPEHLNPRIYFFYIPTSFLAITLGIAVSRQERAEQQYFFTRLNRSPCLAGTAKWLFEHYAHAYFSDPTRQPAIAYLQNDPTPHQIPAPAKTIAGSKLKTIQSPHKFYWRPRASNVQGINAIIRKGNHAWALQYVITSPQNFEANALTKVYDSMNHKRGVQWHLVVVYPQTALPGLGRHYKLGDPWTETLIYACELPLGDFTERDQRRLQQIMNDDSDTYPAVSDERLFWR